jgi:hypothetical protein
MCIISPVNVKIFIHNFSFSEIVNVNLSLQSGRNNTKEVYSLNWNKLQVITNNRSKLSL